MHTGWDVDGKPFGKSMNDGVSASEYKSILISNKSIVNGASVYLAQRTVYAIFDDSTSSVWDWDIQVEVTYIVNIKRGSNYTVSSLSSSYKNCDLVEFTLTPEVCYTISAVTANPSVTITSNSNTYNFTMSGSNVEVMVTTFSCN